MKNVFVIILTLIGFLSFGQEAKVSSIDELDSIYYKALNSRLDLLLQSGWQYIELNENGKRASKLNVSYRYKFLTNDELIDLSIEKKKTIRVLRLTHKTIGFDTIDVNFGTVNVTGQRIIHFNKGLRFKRANFEIEVDEIEGYVPDLRFVFSRERNKWELKGGRYKMTE